MPSVDAVSQNSKVVLLKVPHSDNIPENLIGTKLAFQNHQPTD